jgi:hypothetical protein
MADMNFGSFGGTHNGALTTTYPAGVQTISEKYATYLKLFSGELFKAYQNQTIARDTVMRRTLKNGKSMQFIFTGGLESYYHEPGKPILGATTEGGSTSNKLAVAEKTIIMDDLLVASTFVYDLDEVLAHYDLRGEIARKLGYALAHKYDENIFRAIAKGSRQAGNVAASTGTNVNCGTEIEIGFAARAGQSTHATKLVEGFFRAAQRMDETNVPADGRVAVMSPSSYYQLLRTVDSNDLINRDEIGDARQSGTGLYSIAGIKIMKTNNLPSDFRVARAGENNEYAPAASGTANGGLLGDFRSLQTLIYHRDSAGVVEAIGPEVQTTNGDVSVMYQGDLIVSRLAMGCNHLNTAGAISIVAGGYTDADTQGSPTAVSASTELTARTGSTSQNERIDIA